MEDYDPNRDPDVDEWLELDEQERLLLIEDYHRRHQMLARSPEGHALIHAIVENQLAGEEPVVVATFARLRREGLDRHDSVHAIGSILADHMETLLKGGQNEPGLVEHYYRALEKLSARKWGGG